MRKRHGLGERRELIFVVTRMSNFRKCLTRLFGELSAYYDVIYKKIHIKITGCACFLNVVYSVGLCGAMAYSWIIYKLTPSTFTVKGNSSKLNSSYKVLQKWPVIYA